MEKSKKYVMLAAILCAVSIIIMLAALMSPKTAVTGVFVPPEFERYAVAGEPEVPEKLGFIEPYMEGMSFRAGVCCNLPHNGNSADIYFTNNKENCVWLKLRISDENGNVLAETGLLRPGEYVKSVNFVALPKSGQKVVYRVMAYEPETYISRGYFTLKTIASVSE